MTSRVERQAYIGIANAEGENDADTWLAEAPRSQWAAAVAEGALGADETLINAIGAPAVAKLFGVAEGTEAFADACRHYSAAWADMVRKAIAS